MSNKASNILYWLFLGVVDGALAWSITAYPGICPNEPMICFWCLVTLSIVSFAILLYSCFQK